MSKYSRYAGYEMPGAPPRDMNPTPVVLVPHEETETYKSMKRSEMDFAVYLVVVGAFLTAMVGILIVKMIGESL